MQKLEVKTTLTELSQSKHSLGLYKKMLNIFSVQYQHLSQSI